MILTSVVRCNDPRGKPSSPSLDVVTYFGRRADGLPCACLNLPLRSRKRTGEMVAIQVGRGVEGIYCPCCHRKYPNLSKNAWRSQFPLRKCPEVER